jgi:hypothetical protein
LLLLKVARRQPQVEIALFIGTSSTEASANEGGPSPSPEQEDGEDNTEAQAESGLDEEIGQATIPLNGSIRLQIPCHRIFAVITIPFH